MNGPPANRPRMNSDRHIVRYYTPTTMSALTRTTIATALSCLWIAEAAAEIYACESDDGVAIYQDQPCPAPAPAVAEAEPEQEAEPVDATQVSEAPARAEPVDTELVAACKKRYRDEIDRLYAELASGVASDKREDYRDKARALSQQLSRCEYGGTNSSSGGRRPEPAGRDL